MIQQRVIQLEQHVKDLLARVAVLEAQAQEVTGLYEGLAELQRGESVPFEDVATTGREAED